MARRTEEYEYTYSDPRLKADIEHSQRQRRDRALPPSKREAAAKLRAKDPSAVQPDASQLMEELQELETASAPSSSSSKRARSPAREPDSAADRSNAERDDRHSKRARHSPSTPSASND
jgi:hypothetical protein